MKQLKRWMGFAAVCGLLLTVLAGSAVRARAGELETRLRTSLVATSAGGFASGEAEFEAKGALRQFQVKVQDVNPPVATVQVMVGSGVVGSISLSGGSGSLTLTGNAAPPVSSGTPVAVLLNGTAILAGTF